MCFYSTKKWEKKTTRINKRCNIVTIGSLGHEEEEGKKKYTLIVRRGGGDEQLVKEKYNVASRLKPIQLKEKRRKNKKKVELVSRCSQAAKVEENFCSQLF